MRLGLFDLTFTDGVARSSMSAVYSKLSACHFLFAAGLLLSTTYSAQAATITLNPGGQAGRIEARASDMGTNADIVRETGFPTTVPESGTLLVSDGFNARASSSVDYVFSESGFATAIDVVLPSFGGAFVGFFQDTYFSISDDMIYDLSGTFESAQSEPGRTTLDVMLRDVTTNSLLFHNQQRSLETQNESFVVGGSGGDWVNVVDGMTSGVLFAGHEYQLIQFAFLNNSPGTFASATGSGTISISFTPVPEPGTALLLALGLVALARPIRRPMGAFDAPER